MKVVVIYPTKEQELEMYKKLNSSFKNEKVNKILNKKDIFELQKIVDEIYVSDNVFKYVSDIIDSSRNPENYDLLGIKKYLNYGISPR